MSNASSNPETENLEKTRSEHSKAHVSFGHPLLVIFKTVLIFALSQVLAYLILVLGYYVWFFIRNEQPTFLQIQEKMNEGFEDSVGIQFLAILLAEGMMVFLVYLFLKWRKLSFKSIGFSRPPKIKDLKNAFLGFGAYYLFFILSAAILLKLVPGLNTDQEQDVGFTELQTTSAKLVGLIGLVILPPLAEEILMRGYLYTGLRKYWKFAPSLIVTSLFFGAAHLLTGVGPGLLWLAGFQTFILSAVLVYLREKTGALYSSILVHSFNNLIAFIVYFHR